MKKIENGNFHHTLMSALSCVLLMAVAGGINENMLAAHLIVYFFVAFEILKRALWHIKLKQPWHCGKLVYSFPRVLGLSLCYKSY